MPAKIEVAALTTAEKLELMEQLWESLTEEPDSIPTPDWHRDELAERRRRAESGEEIFQDLSVVKEEIRARIAHERSRP
jgi:hypothetical protein